MSDISISHPEPREALRKGKVTCLVSVSVPVSVPVSVCEKNATACRPLHLRLVSTPCNESTAERERQTSNLFFFFFSSRTESAEIMNCFFGARIENESPG